ncbi:MAG: type V CRISPR-associated protein Cas12a/Cpf1 [Solobacterium sp.]|nr:type V CRISPR-associated protein Cas12a/Cpf1 [Solobacterium sp.]
MKKLEQFTNLYPLSKTLRFRLIPVGKTQENIIKNRVLEEDLEKAENYKKAKVLIDQYHRYFIDDVLSNNSFDWNAYAEAIEHKGSKEEIDGIKADLRKQITSVFEEDKRFKTLFGEKFFSEILKKYYSDDDEALKILASFEGFTTYFVGFYENRRNIYKSDDIATSVTHRLVTENFPYFNGNIHAYKNAKKLIPEKLEFLEKNISEEFHEISFDELFSPNGFNHVLTQNGIEMYNTILGGYTKENKVKIQGINELVNEYGQKNPKDRSVSRMKMTMLYNQILSERISNSFVFDIYETDKDVIDAVEYLKRQYLNVYRAMMEEIFQTLHSDENVLVDNKEIRLMSQRLYGNYSTLESVMYDSFAKTVNNRKAPNKKQEEAYKKISSHTIKEINNAITIANEKNEKTCNLNEYYTRFTDILNFIDAEWKICLNSYNESMNLRSQYGTVENIKGVLDSLIETLKTIRCYDHQSADISNSYLTHAALNKYDNEVYEIYNKIRNYITKKPFSNEKIKLNFNNSQLASGWSVTKETDCRALILRKNGYFYLGILNTNHTVEEQPESTDGYEKMKYQYISGVNKMLPKCIFTKAVKAHFSGTEKNKDCKLFDKKKMIEPLLITPYDYQVYSEGRMKKEYLKNGSEKEYRRALTDWIELCQNMFKKYKSWLDFDLTNIKKPEEYESLDQFYKDLDNACYKVTFVNVSQEQIDCMVNDGTLYLFKIYNKDFAEGAHGSENLHTKYFKAIFSSHNLSTGIFQLNGGAELFWRKASLDNQITHKKNSYLINKVTSDGETIPANIYNELYRYYNNKCALSEAAQAYLSKAVVKKARFDISKDKRYKEDQFFFHVPIKINYKQRDVSRFNDMVNDYLKNNKDIRIIGIDRGERNLLYVNLLDRSGHILEQKSFNIVNECRYDGSVRKIDYLSKLELREKERDESRKSWQSIGTIKELKEGYLSSIIHEIAKMMIDNNAILVMENLNSGFKRGRMKFERQVYQKFEMMLINKLNLFALKSLKDEETGSIYHAYQLTNKLTAYSEVYNQTGFIFYVNAGFTSKVDPVTGFADVFYRAKMKEEYRNFVEKLDKFVYDEGTDMFMFSFSYSNYPVNVLPYHQKWDVYTNGKRIIHNNANGKHTYRTVDVTKELKNLLKEYGIVYKDNDLKKEICSMTDTREKNALQNKVLELFFETIQLRNSNPKTGEDYIISPVMDKDGKFFLSDVNDKSLPCDADANGAYNIARKGLMILKKIDEGKSSSDLKITNEEWFAYIQK